jgi:hypothetical protein
LAKQVSDADYGRAQLIAERLWEHKSLGDGQLARMLGFHWRTVSQKVRSRSRIRELMGVAVRIMAVQHPGFTIRRPGGGLAEVTDNADVVTKVVLPRLMKAHTALLRADSEATVLRSSNNPVQHEVAAGIRVSLASLAYSLQEVTAKESERLQALIAEDVA